MGYRARCMHALRAVVCGQRLVMVRLRRLDHSKMGSILPLGSVANGCCTMHEAAWPVSKIMRLRDKNISLAEQSTEQVMVNRTVKSRSEDKF